MSVTVCLLTPLAPGGVAVIRLSGDASAGLLARVCRRTNVPQPMHLSPGRLSYGHFFDGDDVLDDIVAAIDARGRIEICLHGGVRVVQRAIMVLERWGAHRVEPEEVSLPVNPLDVHAAVDALLPRAVTRRMAAWVLAQRALLPRFMHRCLGRAEPAVTSTEWDAFDRASRAAIRAFAELRIVLAGPPNAGKSTLANALLGRDRAITSNIPGTTRDWVEETTFIDGWPVTLTDTAGRRPTDDGLEAEAIRRGVQQAGRADLVIWVEDAANPGAVAGPNGFTSESAVLFVASKIDVAGAAGSRPSAVRVSGLTGQGLRELGQDIARLLGIDLLNPGQPAAFEERQHAECRAMLHLH